MPETLSRRCFPLALNTHSDTGEVETLVGLPEPTNWDSRTTGVITPSRPLLPPLLGLKKNRECRWRRWILTP